VVVGGDQVATSTAPADGKWAVHELPGFDDVLFGVSCASKSLCVAVGNTGKILASTEPTTSKSWMPARVPGARNVYDVSCPSKNLCVALGHRGRALIGMPGPPDTVITAARIKPRRHKAHFRFKAMRAVATRFQCKLKKLGPRGVERRARYRRCSSPASYPHLRHGRFIFKVRARNAIGADPTPATKSFRIRR